MSKQKAVWIIIILFLVISLISAENAPKVMAVTTKYIVKATSVEYTIDPGEKITLYINTKETIKWSSSNKKIATITKKGIVTGVSEGKAIITAQFGKKKYKCTIVVYDEEAAIQASRDAAEDEFKAPEKDDILDPNAKYVFVTPTPEPNSDIDSSLNDIVNGEESQYASEKGKEDELANAWIGEDELKTKYNISIAWEWYNNKIRFIKDNTDIFVINLPKVFRDETVYTFDFVRYQHVIDPNISKVTYKFYFSREDLINQGIIK